MADQKISELTEKTTLADNDLFVIVDSEESDIEKKDKKIKAGNVDCGIFREQDAVVVNITAIPTSETNVLNLATASTHYIVRDLVLKSANPGINAITVRLYRLVNGTLALADSFIFDSTNFGVCQTLMDMFGVSYLAGDQLKVTVQASGGTYTITGEYSYAKTT